MSLANQVADDRGRWRDDWGHGFVLVYGSYRHALGEATVVIERRTQFSD